MKRTQGLLLLLGVMLVSLTGLASATPINYYVPAPWAGVTAGTPDGNPYTDAGGNTWGVYSLDMKAGDVDSDFSTYTKMNWDGSKWMGVTNYGGYPSYGAYAGYLMARGGYGAGVNLVGSMVFTAGKTGEYSFLGSVYVSDAGHTAPPTTTLTIGKFTGVGDTWTQLHSDAYAMASSVQLDAISALQSIALQAGEKIVINVHSDMTIYSSTGDVSLDSTGLAYEVPEPATLGLLVAGVTGT